MAWAVPVERLPRLGWQLGAAFLLYIVVVCIYRLTFHPLAKYPGPLLGKLTSWYGAYHAYTRDLHLDVWRCHEKYGKYVRYSPNRLLVNTNTGLKDIYGKGKNVRKSKAYLAFLITPGGFDTQTTIDKTVHGRKRRVISQGFSDAAMRTSETHILNHVRSFCTNLSVVGAEFQSSPDSHLWSSTKNMADWCSYLSFDLMAETVFGRATRMLEAADSRFIVDLLGNAAHRIGILSQMPELASWKLDRLLFPTISKRRDKFVQLSKKMAVDKMQTEENRGQDIFSCILAAKDPESGEGFPMSELWAESALLMVAGSETTSTAMAALLFYLSQNRRAYAKVCAEVRGAFSSAEDIRTGPQLSSLTYLRACLDETMRISPPVGGVLWREVMEGGLDLDGEHVPAGYDVGVGIYCIHHNPAYYPQPFDYVPERWIASKQNPQEAVDLARSAFTPFSKGPRNCIGKGLAYMELTLAMARVLWMFDFRAVDDCMRRKGMQEPSGVYRQHLLKEYRLKDQFTSWKDGPMLQFRAR